MNKYIYVCVCVLLTWQSSAADGATHDDADRLLRDIKSNYNGDIRPVVYQSDVVNITMALYIVDVLEFDELLETLKTSAAIALFWFDQGTQWKANEYGGMKNITLRHFNFLWTPTIALGNTADRMANIFEDKECVAILLNSGQIIISPPVLMHSSCKVDITYYPFDIQTCGFSFYVFGDMLNGVEFDTENTYMDMEFFTPTGAWTLIDTNTILQRSYVVFELVLQRKPHYVVLNIIIPIIALSILNVFVFCIPVESGERISYCLTVLLSLAVFLTLVGQTLPKTSEPMSWFSFSLVGTVLTSIGITITVIFNMRLYFRDDSSDVGSFWDKVMSCLPKGKSSEKNSSPENLYINTQDNQYVQHGNNENSINGLVSFGDTHVLSTGHCANVNIINSSYLNRGVDLQTSCKENTSVSHDDNIETDNAHNLSEVKVTWKEVTQFIDKIGFIFFLMILLCTYILFAVKSIYRI